MRSIWAGSSTVRPQESVNWTVSAVPSSEGWALGVWETEGSGEPEADGLASGVVWVQAASESIMARASSRDRALCFINNPPYCFEENGLYSTCSQGENVGRSRGMHTRIRPSRRGTTSASMP